MHNKFFSNEKFFDEPLSEEVIKGLAKMADRVPYDILARCWQVVLKNHGELKSAPNMFSALQMGILRVSFFASLPGPIDLVAMISEGISPVSSF